MKIYLLELFDLKNGKTECIGIFSTKDKAVEFEENYPQFCHNAKINFDEFYPTGAVFEIKEFELDKVFYGKLFNQYMEV